MKIVNNKKPTRGEDRNYHFLYRIEHIPTGKFYVGRHSTDNIGDGYRGSGTNIVKMFELFDESEFRLLRLSFFKTKLKCQQEETKLIKFVIDDEKCLNIQKTATKAKHSQCKYPCACQVSKTIEERAFTGIREYSKNPDAYTEDLLILKDLSSKALLVWSFLIRTRHLEFVKDWKTVSDTRVNLRSVLGVGVDLYHRGLREDIMRILDVKTETPVRKVMMELVSVGFMAYLRPKYWVINPFHFFRGTKIAHQVCRENWLEAGESFN